MVNKSLKNNSISTKIATAVKALKNCDSAAVGIWEVDLIMVLVVVSPSSNIFLLLLCRVAQENRHGFALSSSGLHFVEWLAGKTGRANLFGCYRCWFALSFVYSFVNLQIRDAIWGDYQKMQHAGATKVTTFLLIFWEVSKKNCNILNLNLLK